MPFNAAARSRVASLPRSVGVETGRSRRSFEIARLRFGCSHTRSFRRGLLHQVIDDAHRTERTQRDIVKAHQTGLPQREFLQNAFRLFRCACVDDEDHTFPVGAEIPLVYLAREIRIHRVMHLVRHDLSALGGRRHTRSAPSTHVLDAERRQERTDVIAAGH